MDGRMGGLDELVDVWMRWSKGRKKRGREGGMIVKMITKQR